MPDLMEAFLNWGSFLSGDSSLCQIDTHKPASTAGQHKRAHTSVHMHGITHTKDANIYLKKQR